MGELPSRLIVPLFPPRTKEQVGKYAQGRHDQHVKATLSCTTRSLHEWASRASAPTINATYGFPARVFGGVETRRRNRRLPATYRRTSNCVGTNDERPANNTSQAWVPVDKMAEGNDSTKSSKREKRMRARPQPQETTTSNSGRKPHVLF